MHPQEKMAKCYLRHSKIPVEEDLTHEFKAHRDLSDLDLSDNRFTVGINGPTEKAPRCRATLSKSICGMLNTGDFCIIRAKQTTFTTQNQSKFHYSVGRFWAI